MTKNIDIRNNFLLFEILSFFTILYPIIPEQIGLYEFILNYNIRCRKTQSKQRKTMNKHLFFFVLSYF